jgi:ADP-heptose:LPS heptosyltransferase
MFERQSLVQQAPDCRPHWQSVQHLLLAYEFDQAGQTDLNFILGKLHQSLPWMQVGILTGKGSLWQLSLPDSDTLLTMPRTNFARLIQAIAEHQFDAALILAQPFQSPYSLAYLAYLAGIPIRIGHSREFGGSLLSHTVQPPVHSASSLAHYWHLLNAVGL